tara:strand:- start:16207 stop:16590 length:384 start_codon:yes stop_codon:yes gene_type:complete
MPLYDFKCYLCDKLKPVTSSVYEYEKLKDTVVCDCGQKMSRVILNCPAMHDINTVINDDLSVDDMMFSSQREKADYCKNNNLVKMTDKEALEEQKYKKKIHKEKRTKQKKDSFKKICDREYGKLGIK